MASVLNLYRGDLLADFYLPECQAFEDWLIVEREHFRRLAETGLATYSRVELESRTGLVAFHFAERNDLKQATPYAFHGGQHAVRLAAWVEAAVFLNWL